MFFQISEIGDAVEDLETMSYKDIVKSQDELKNLRVNMVRTNAELKLIQVDEDHQVDYNKRIEGVLQQTKDMLKQMK